MWLSLTVIAEDLAGTEVPLPLVLMTVFLFRGALTSLTLTLLGTGSGSGVVERNVPCLSPLRPNSFPSLDPFVFGNFSGEETEAELCTDLGLVAEAGGGERLSTGEAGRSSTAAIGMLGRVGDAIDVVDNNGFGKGFSSSSSLGSAGRLRSSEVFDL